jgi:molybdopterin-binding protein
MKLSARNQFRGKVIEIKEGVVTSEVIVDIGGGNTMVSIISKDSVERLGISVGQDVTTLVKSTSVMLMTE